MKTILLFGTLVALVTSSSMTMAMAKYPSSYDMRVAYCQRIVGPIVNRVQNDITWEDEGHSDAALKFQKYHQCLAKVGL